MVVLGGDFRQILPVVQKGTRADIVNASLNYSHLWSHCKVLTLTQTCVYKEVLTTQNLNKLKNS